MKKLRGILVTPNKKGTEPRDVTIDYDGFKTLYELLECDMLEIPQYKFGDHCYDVYCDEEGLFKANNKPSILAYNPLFGRSMVVGSVFIVGRNNRSLNDKQVKEILSTMANAEFKDGTRHKLLVSRV